MKVKFYDSVEDTNLLYTVIVSKHNNKWVFCKHKKRDTLECPGGTREANESIETCAIRELQEESGAVDFTMQPICVYSVTGKTKKHPIYCETFGMLYYATIDTFTTLHSEMERIYLLDELPNNFTYPDIQPLLIERVCVHLLLQDFYNHLSFHTIHENTIEQLTSLCSDSATVQDANGICSMASYLLNFQNIMKQYPHLFTNGFIETQLRYDYQKESHAIYVHSYYQKEYNNTIEYGVNHIHIQKVDEAYKIMHISYEENN